MSELLRPSYHRTRLRPRMLHIGLGAFARAHVLAFHDDMLRRTNSDWGVIAARLHSGMDDLTLLDDADGLYTIGEMSGDDISLKQVGAIIKTLHPVRDGIDALLAQIADPELCLVTLTITEKGYCLKDGHLDPDHPEVSRDLASPGNARSAVGVLGEGLRRRWRAGLAPLTVLSCDNLPSNGKLCRTAIAEFADRLDPAFGNWVREACRFPCSMVDRITPAMTDASHRQLAEALGRADPNGILCEPFRQWVIEDDFAGDRPAWDLVGAEVVGNVAPYEDMKLRLLNGSHSFLAYLGALADIETIAECMLEPDLVRAARQLMLEEQAVTLDIPEGVDIALYADTLIDRFSNTALHHKTTQIASDGSQKLPQRLLQSARAHLRWGRSWPLTALAIAGWMLYCRGKSEQGEALPLNDPLSATITAIAGKADGADYVEELLTISEIFSTDLPASVVFCTRIQSAFEQLRSRGVLKSVAAVL